MLITKNRKTGLTKSLDALQNELDVFEALRVEVSERFGLDLFTEIQENILYSLGINDGYIDRAKATADDLRSFSKGKMGSLKECVRHIQLADKYTSKLKLFIYKANEKMPTFDFNATMDIMKANVNGLLGYVNAFVYEVEGVTRSGADCIEVYRNKVRVNLLTDLRILELIENRGDEIDLYDKMTSKYLDLKHSDYSTENIFSTSTESPQVFLNSEIAPSKVKADLAYFVEYFETRDLMEDETYDEAIGEHNLKNMTELSTIVFDKWKASNPTEYSKAYYEYIPPVSSNFTEIIRNSKESWDDMMEGMVERKFFLELQKFSRIGSWVLLWNYARAKNMTDLVSLCEDHLANIVDNRTSRKASYDNYAEFNSVVSRYVLSPN